MAIDGCLLDQIALIQNQWSIDTDIDRPALAFEKVEKIPDIMKFGVMMTPALVVDGQVKSSGKVLSADQIADLLK